MTEKKFQSYFNRWVKHVYRKTAAFELKVAKGASLPFRMVIPHQVEALWNVRNGVLVQKLIDCGYQNPFDCFCLAKMPAFVVVRYPTFFCLIDINDWKNEVAHSLRKSLLQARAREIATEIIEL